MDKQTIKEEDPRSFFDRAAWAGGFVPQFFRDLALDGITDKYPERVDVNAAAERYVHGIRAGQLNPLFLYGEFDSRDGYRSLEQRARHEYRVVKVIYTEDEVSVVDLNDPDVVAQLIK